MFSLFKPAHVALRNMLSPAVARQYDEVVGMFIDTVPSDWSKQTRDRTITLVMADWVTANADAGRIQIHSYVYKKAEHFYDVCLKFNDRDFQNGSTSTWMAGDIRRALREEDIIPPIS